MRKIPDARFRPDAMILVRGWRHMTGRGYTIFDTGIGRCAIAWGAAGLVGVQLPEIREIDTRRRLYLYPDARELRPPPNVGAISKRRLLSIEGAQPIASKTLFDVLLPVAPPQAHP